jgi:hypothetical protein
MSWETTRIAHNPVVWAVKSVPLATLTISLRNRGCDIE